MREYSAVIWLDDSLAAGRFDVVHVCNPPDLFCSRRSLRREGLASSSTSTTSCRSSSSHDSDAARTPLPRPLAPSARRSAWPTSSSPRTSLPRRRGRAGRSIRTKCLRRAERPDLRRFGPGRQTPSASAASAPPRLPRRHGSQDGVDYALRARRAARRRRRLARGLRRRRRRRPADARLRRRAGPRRGHIHGPGPRRDVQTILTTADVCLAPDPKNPLNDVSTMNKILEYMAVGTPVVSYDLREARASAGEAACYVRVMTRAHSPQRCRLSSTIPRLAVAWAGRP